VILSPKNTIIRNTRLLNVSAPIVEVPHVSHRHLSQERAWQFTDVSRIWHGDDREGQKYVITPTREKNHVYHDLIEDTIDIIQEASCSAREKRNNSSRARVVTAITIHACMPCQNAGYEIFPRD
jgi:hypothetical protein